MTAIVCAPLTGEIIAPGGGITLVLALHPLKLDREVMTAPAGLTLAELAEYGRARATTRLRSRFVIHVGADRVPSELWQRVRPKPGTTVLLRAVAEFGGDNSLLRSILTIAVLAASVFLAPIIAPALGLAAGLVGAAITVGGQLLINALFPIGQPQLASSASKSQSYSLSGGQNAADPFGVIPSILGRNRVYPKLGARPYTEFIGADQYLRMLFVWGYGPLDITDIKIGETLLSSFADVEVETRYGYAGDTPVTLYPGEVVQDDLSVDLTFAAGWQSRTTATAIAEISIDLVAPGGIVRLDDQGASQNYTVSIRAEYRLTGSTGAWSLLGSIDLTSRSSDALRQALRVTVANGQYDVRVSKTSSDYAGGDNKVQEQVLWTALRGFRNDPPIEFAQPLAVTALRIRATSQLNGVVDQLNGIVSSRVANAYNGAAWLTDQPSRNPADLFRHVLQGPANARPQSDTRVDLATLERWWSYCDSEGFAFDQIRDFTASVQSVLGDIAAAGRAAPIFRDGKWSVVWDETDAPVVQHFTPRNSWGFSGHRVYQQTPHGFRARFINAAAGYQQDERIVYDDGYDASNATLFEQIEFPGVTDTDVVWRDGRFHIAQARLRPETYSLTVDVEHLVATRGDRVRCTHDVPMFGLVSGRVKAVFSQTVTLDEPITMVAGKSYSFRFRLIDGSSLYRTAATVAGAQTVVTLIGSSSDMPAAGDLFMGGETGQESVILRIKSITPGDDIAAKLTLVDDAPEISSADTGDIPPYDSQITVPGAAFAERPTDLKLREGFQGTGDNSVTGVFFSWSVPAGQSPSSFEAQFADRDGDGIYKPAGTAVAPLQEVFLTGYQAGHWSFRVRSHFADGGLSDWAVLNDQPLQGGGTTAVLAPGSITLEQLRASIQAKLGWFQEGLNDLQENLAAISGTLQDQDAANYDDKRTVLVNLKSQVGAVNATIQSVAETLATSDTAIAATATAAQATANAGTASGLLKMQVESNPAGVDAKITQYLSTVVGGGTTSAFEVLEIASDGTSTKTFVCDIFQVLAGGASSGFIVDTRTGNISMGSLT